MRGLVDTTVEGLAGEGLSQETLRSRVVFENLELLRSYEDKPVLLVSAHQGNWEWQLLALSAELSQPVEAVYAPSQSPLLEGRLRQIRSRFGVHLIPREDTFKEVARRLKEPRVVVLLADQNPRRDVERRWLKFLNQDTAFPVGIDKLALLTRYPVIFQESRRTERGCYQVRFHLLAEPPYEKEGDQVLKAYARALEASINSQRDDWLWSYDRWRYPKPLYAQGDRD